MRMVTKSSRKDLWRLLLFSFGGLCVGLFIAGLIALLMDSVAATNGAADWRDTDDCVVVYYHLSEDAAWPDGTPMTADDVVYSYAAVLLGAETGHSVSGAQRTAAEAGLICEKVDDRVLRFTISAASRPEMVAMGFDIVPKNELAEYIYNLNPLVPVGSFRDRPTLD